MDSYIVPSLDVEVIDEQTVKFSCAFISNKVEENLWVELSPPPPFPNGVDNYADSWVRMLIFEMMHVGGAFHVKGTMSLTFLQNLENFIEAYVKIYPEKLHPITIIPDGVRDDRNDVVDDSAIALFSQGLDASYSVYRHAKGLAGYNTLKIGAGLYVHGFDRGLLEDGVFESQLEDAKESLEDIGIPELYTCRTNYPEESFPSITVWEGMPWNHHLLLVHIAMGCSLASFWSSKFKNVLFSSSAPYGVELLRYNGTRPEADYLLSSRSFRCYEEGFGATRTEKADLVKNWKKGMDKLRVCWFPCKEYKNCGKCEKCVRTKMNFLACGVEWEGPWISKDLSDRQMVKDVAHLKEYVSILDFAEKEGRGSESWANDLKEKLRRAYGDMYTKGTFNHDVTSSSQTPEKAFVTRKEVADLTKQLSVLSADVNYSRIRMRYYRCKILSKVMLGMKRRHYKEKKILLRGELRRLRNILRSK